MLHPHVNEYALYRNNKEFGDGVITAMVVRILNDNKIPAVLDYPNSVLMDLMDCPKPILGKEYIRWDSRHTPECTNDGRSMLQKTVENFVKENGIRRSIEITQQIAPVVFYDIDVPMVDVAMNTKCGYYGKFREWNYFPELKSLLDDKGITYVDMDQEKILGVEALNYVSKAKLYLGLETGMSHYVSGVSPKALIIQGGYSTLSYWSTYGFDCIELENVACKNCFLKPPSNCDYNYHCMNNITPEMVLDHIVNLLNL